MEGERCIFCENVIERKNDDNACIACLTDISRSGKGGVFFVVAILVVVIVLWAIFW